MSPKYRNYRFIWKNYPTNYQEVFDAVNCRFLTAGRILTDLVGVIVFVHPVRQAFADATLPDAEVAVSLDGVEANNCYINGTHDVVYKRGDKPLTQREKAIKGFLKENVPCACGFCVDNLERYKEYLKNLEQ